MCLVKNAAIAAALALTGTMAAVALPAAAETIVVKASGPSAKVYPAGRKLPDTGTLTLKSGDVVTLLDGRGTRTLRGPGSFGITAAVGAGTDTRTSLASLLETKRVRRARTGAVRGNGSENAVTPRSPNLWYVDLSQSSTACIADPANVRLWRPGIGQAATVTVTPARGGASTTVSFATGESVASWPASLPVVDGAAYRLNWAGLARPVDIRFSVMQAASEGLESMAASLIARQCDAQLNLLAETVALPDPAPQASGG